jgi:hypothetical protein
VLGFASNARARRSTAGTLDAGGVVVGVTFEFDPAAADVPAEITAAAPSAMAAIPAATPSTVRVNGEGRLPLGTSIAQMLDGASVSTSSASRAGSWTTGMSGTVVTPRPSP